MPDQWWIKAGLGVGAGIGVGCLIYSGYKVLQRIQQVEERNYKVACSVQDSIRKFETAVNSQIALLQELAATQSRSVAQTTPEVSESTPTWPWWPRPAPEPARGQSKGKSGGRSGPGKGAGRKRSVSPPAFLDPRNRRWSEDGRWLQVWDGKNWV